MEQMAGSASVYRYKRTQELLQQNYPLTPQKVANILRDYKGLGGADIGVGNEKAVNQFVAHHSVIFMPDSLRMWVSTSPWQMGEYVCYDLRKIFAMDGLKADAEIADVNLNIAPDSFLNTSVYAKFMLFRQAKMRWMDKLGVQVSQFIPNNPQYYDAYRLTGDYYLQHKDYEKAINAYQAALGKEIATQAERKSIEGKIKECEKALAEHR
jgi:tetratricopeptide (TPR) repeat protein